MKVRLAAVLTAKYTSGQSAPAPCHNTCREEVTATQVFMTSHSELGFVHASEYNRVRHEHGIEGERGGGVRIAVQVREFFCDSNTDLVVKDRRPFGVRFQFPPLDAGKPW